MAINPKYCCHCGHQLIKDTFDGKDQFYCTKCQEITYQNPLPVVASVVMNERNEVLLVKRKNNPQKDLWCLPMGFVETGETIAQATLRELKEETNLDGDIVKILDAASTNLDIYGDIIIITFEVVKLKGELKAGDDAEEVNFFPIKDLPEMAFSSNLYAIKYCVQALEDNL